MNFPFPPRSRAALTPTAGVGNRFPVPSSGSASGSSSGSKVRRGFTPRSASRVRPGYGGGSSNGAQVKPRLTPQQQLEIIQRLEAGNFKKEVGLSQFYEEFGTDLSSKNNDKVTKCKQNLFSSFVSVDPLASSTRNYGNGMAGSMESLISVGSSIISSTTVVEGGDVTCLEAPIMGSHISETDEYYNTVPDYIRAFDRLLSTKDKYRRKMEELAEVQCAATFAQLLPQETMEKVQKIIKKFLDGNSSENMQMFMPSPKSKGPSPQVIHCDVEYHSKLISAFHKLSEIMVKLDSFLNQEHTDSKLEAKMESFKDLVSKLEDAIKSQDEYSQGVKEMIMKTEVLDLDESNLQDSETETFEELSSP